jgi:cell wall-associated NlpC family hydrolase
MKNNSLFGRMFFLIIVVMVLNGHTDIKSSILKELPGDNTAIEHRSTEKENNSSVRNEFEHVITELNNKEIHPDSIVAFARTLIGIPYRYGSINPAIGFDCSGFITYVFNHFNISVPRSSINFTHYGKEVAVEKSKPGDLILFTGTNIKIRKVGHMGIVESVKNDTLYFIHSSSGKANGVVISPLGKYYKSRFIKVIRVFDDDLFK